MGRIYPKEEPTGDNGDGFPDEIKMGVRLVSTKCNDVVEVIGLDKDGYLRTKILVTAVGSGLHGITGYYAITPKWFRHFWRTVEAAILDYIAKAEAAEARHDKAALEHYVSLAEEIEKWKE